VLILKPESVPSARACQLEHSHPAIYHADLHLLYVAYTRAMHALLVAETEAQHEAREKLETESMGDSQSSVLDMLDERQPEMLHESNKDANPAFVLQDALDTLELPESPSTLRELSTYVKTKRKHSAFDDNALGEFDRASKVVRRHLMFSSVGGCSTLGAPPPPASAPPPPASASNDSHASAVTNEIASGTRDAAVDALIQKELTHLTPEQRAVAKEWLEQGFNIAEADAAAIHLLSYEEHASNVAQAAAEGRDLQWQTLLATALGAGEWANDWHLRHRALLDANDSVLAAALAVEELQ
jgi:ATP-dependent exoDNAse (exonuclease V) beta subunit